MTGPDAPGLPPLEIREGHLTVDRSALFCSAGGHGKVEEIWVVLHGFGMHARDFLGWFRPVVTPHRLVVAPEALNRYYTNHKTGRTGATWMTRHERLFEIEDYVRYLDQLLEVIRAEVGTNVPVQVHAFSQGAATGARWVSYGKVRPTRLVLWGGGVPPDLELARHRERLEAADVTIVVGDRDQYLNEEQIQAEVQRLTAGGLTFRLERFTGGHVIPWPLLESIAAGPA